MQFIVSTQRLLSAASPSSCFPSALHGLLLRLHEISDPMPGAPSPLLLHPSPSCFLCCFSFLFASSSSVRHFLSFFKCYHKEGHHLGQGAQLCPAEGPLEPSGTICVRHRAALASAQRGPADPMVSTQAWTSSKTLESLSAYLTSITTLVTMCYTPYTYMNLIRCLCYPHHLLDQNMKPQEKCLACGERRRGVRICLKYNYASILFVQDLQGNICQS